MPQIFQVLRCYKCLVFQVHQTKKSNKWECKLCGEKQSVKRHYGLGTAKDCRIHVQKLNIMRGEIDTLKKNQDQNNENSENEGDVAFNIQENNQPVRDSIWSNYVEEPVEEKCTENMTLGDAEIVLEMPKKHRKQHFKRHPKWCLPSVDHNNIQENFQKECLTVSAPVVVNTHSVSSKMSQPNMLSGDLSIKQESSNITRNDAQKKFVPPVLNKDSKWAEFTEDAEENKETAIAPSPSLATSQNELLFSLCDDSDLDNVLNI